MSEGTEIVKADSMTIERLQERDRFEVAMGMAKVYYTSRMFPQYQSAEQIFVAAKWAHENDVPETTALRMIYFANGRMGFEADLMKGLVKRRSKARFEYAEKDGQCVLTAFRLDTDEQYVSKWTLERAQRAGLAGKDTYKKHPGTMLRHRCDGEACRALWPDIVGGMYVREEMEEIVDAEAHLTADSTAAIADKLGITDGGGADSAEGRDEAEGKEQPSAAPDIIGTKSAPSRHQVDNDSQEDSQVEPEGAEPPAEAAKDSQVPAEEPASEGEIGDVVLIDNGPVLPKRPSYVLCATVGPVELARHQTIEGRYFCGDCKVVKLDEGEATCPHLEAYKAKLKEGE